MELFQYVSIMCEMDSVHDFITGLKFSAKMHFKLLGGSTSFPIIGLKFSS